MEQHLKELIRSTEKRYIDYGVQLKQYFVLKMDFPWYKEYLREMQSIEESLLSKLRGELTDFREDLDGKYMYYNK